MTHIYRYVIPNRFRDAMGNSSPAAAHRTLAYFYDTLVYTRTEVLEYSGDLLVHLEFGAPIAELENRDLLDCHIWLAFGLEPCHRCYAHPPMSYYTWTNPRGVTRHVCALCAQALSQMPKTDRSDFLPPEHPEARAGGRWRVADHDPQRGPEWMRAGYVPNPPLAVDDQWGEEFEI